MPHRSSSLGHASAPAIRWCSRAGTEAAFDAAEDTRGAIEMVAKLTESGDSQNSSPRPRKPLASRPLRHPPGKDERTQLPHFATSYHRRAIRPRQTFCHPLLCRQLRMPPGNPFSRARRGGSSPTAHLMRYQSPPAGARPSRAPRRRAVKAHPRREVSAQSPVTGRTSASRHPSQRSSRAQPWFFAKNVDWSSGSLDSQRAGWSAGWPSVQLDHQHDGCWLANK